MMLINLFVFSILVCGSAVRGQSVDSDCVFIGKNQSRIVCVCNDQTCSDLSFEWPSNRGQASLVTSSKSGLRFATESIDLSNDVTQTTPLKIQLDLANERQQILGWGGAFTDAATINIASLSESVSKRLIESYYGPNGLRYNFGRVPIGGSDFSTRPYTYLDSDEPDYDLKNWKLAPEDLNFKIPTIKEAVQIAKSYGTNVKLFASPWSAPAWMKSNDSLVRGHLKSSDQIYTSYANYLVRFYEEYKKRGVNFWGGTVQNEPVVSYLPSYFFNSMQFSNKEMIDLVANYLGPALRKAGYTKDNFKLIVGDDSLLFVNRQASEVLSNERVQEFVSGLAFHWYTSGTLAPYSTLTSLYESCKDHIEFMLMSEACTGSQPYETKKVDLGSWNRGEQYASDIIEDLKRRANGWIDWNMALDMQGGPNWSKNFVDSPIIVNSEKDEFYKQPMYYNLAHFTRFFRPGSTIVKGKTKGSSSDLKYIAAINKQTGHAIVNILNKSTRNQKVTIEVSGGYRYSFSVEGKSINSLVVKL